jgi:transposase
MASIIKKTIKGHQYYYARECRRVDGKPKIVWQKYLGRVDDIVHAITQAQCPSPEEVDVVEFGLSCALYDIADKLGLVGIIDRCCPKREQGASIGEYMLLAAINRCCKPTSKSKIAQWYTSTVLRRLMPVSSSVLTSQRFWDNMTLVTPERIRAIERELASALIEREGVDPSCLLYDTTNFFTYIDTDTASDIPQRGHNKQKRTDLKQIGLALLVSRDHRIPLFHEAYRGNTHDSCEFASVIEELIRRFKEFARHCQDITLVFDKGNNSQDNLERCGPYHYVGSLVTSQHSDLTSIPVEQYADIGSGYRAYLTRKKVFGKEHVICLTWSEDLYRTQMRGLRLQLSKRISKLQTLQGKLQARERGLVRHGRKPTAAAVTRCAAGIIKGQHMEQIISYDVTDQNGQVTFAYSVDEESISRIAKTHFGKSILFTDRQDMDAPAIADTYHAQYKIEDAFKQMKDPHHVSFWPVYHWTDQKIRVHVFYCVLALTLSSLLSRRIERAGLNLSPEEAYEQLFDINEVLLVYPRTKGKPKVVTTISKMRDVQYKLFNVLNLGRFTS